MEQLQNINDYVLSQSALIGFQELLIKLILTTFLSLLIAHAYVKFSSQITPSKKYYTYISILAIIVTIIISVVKGSLALSLGLVGALSIVRFRTAIKEPNELLVFFISIAIGISIGANQYKVAVLSAFFIFIFYFISYKLRVKKNTEEFTIISISIIDKCDFSQLINGLKNIIDSSFLIRAINSKNDVIEMHLEVSSISVDEIDSLQLYIKEKYNNSEIKIIPKIL